MSGNEGDLPHSEDTGPGSEGDYFEEQAPGIVRYRAGSERRRTLPGVPGSAGVDPVRPRSTAGSAEVRERAARLRSRLPERVSRETVGIAVLVVLAVVCAGLITAVVIRSEDDADAAARAAAAYSPPPLTVGNSPGPGSTIAVITDEAVAGAADGDGDRWPSLLEDRLDSDAVTLIDARGGYIAPSAGEPTFTDSAARIPSGTDVVVFIGGAPEGEVSALALARAATAAFSTASQRAPSAKLIVVGPIYRSRDATRQESAAARSVLRSAAAVAEVDWIDPIASGWLSRVDSTAGPSAADQGTIARKISTEVRTAAR